MALKENKTDSGEFDVRRSQSGFLERLPFETQDLELKIEGGRESQQG